MAFTPPQRRRGAHYIPKPHYRSEDASRHCQSLVNALSSWIADALGGLKRHRLTSVNSAMIARDSDTIRCDVAAALATATEWDGFELAHQLRVRGWPGDIELVRACNQWSCALMDNIMLVRRNSGANFTRGGS